MPKDYGRIWQDLRAKYGEHYRSEAELREVHLRWKRLAAEARMPKGGKRR